MALALSHQSGWPMALTTLVVVIVGIALIGAGVQRFLDRFNAWLLPVYLLGMLAAVWLAIDGYGYPEGWLTRVPEGGAPAYGWWHTFTYYMGIWVLMMFTFDYARFGKDSDRRFHARITFGLPFYALAFGFSAVVGILLDATLPTAGLSEAAIVMGLLELMGLAGLVLVWVTQSRINTANYFLATSNLASLLGQWRAGQGQLRAGHGTGGGSGLGADVGRRVRLSAHGLGLSRHLRGRLGRGRAESYPVPRRS